MFMPKPKPKPKSKPSYEELEEQLLQLRKLIAPKAVFPSGWKLTNRQSELLAALSARKQVSRDQLATALFPNGTGEEDIRIVDQFAKQIRRKLEAAHINVTKVPIYGVGYKIGPDETARQLLRSYIEEV